MPTSIPPIHAGGNEHQRHGHSEMMATLPHQFNLISCLSNVYAPHDLDSMGILHFMKKMPIYLGGDGYLLYLDGKIYHYIHPISWQGMARGNDHQGHGHSVRMPPSPINLKRDVHQSTIL